MPIASAGIFRKDLQIKKPQSKFDVPKEVFEAVQRVIISKSEEIIKTPSGIFIISYSSSGPFQTEVQTEDRWLPVKVMRIEKWSSGGVRESEMVAYERNT